MKLNVNDLPMKIKELKSGDLIYLSGTVYTARDAAHKRICELIEKSEALPFPLKNSAIYYAGPTETKEGHVIGSCGPTTSARMDKFTPTLYDLGLICTIGKGERNEEVVDSIKKNSAIYLCAIGGAGALAAKCITEAKVIAFHDLGCESVKELKLKDFPLVVGIDSFGNSIFK
jgi:fumarate hydratase subunit beta